jgi:hypothetical protein
VSKKLVHIVFLFLISACATQNNSFVQPQIKNLYDVQNANASNEINGFKATTIFADDLDNTVWVSKEKNCVTLLQENKETYRGKSSLHITWDKPNGGCKWIGLGFGWNNWLAKDMSEIVEDAQIEFFVKSVKGNFSNLPVAFAIEDYTGVQSYYGFNNTLVQGEFTTSAWRKVSIPLSNFPFIKNDADVSKIKQFMIQLEGDGDIYLDEIKIVANEKK